MKIFVPPPLTLYPVHPLFYFKYAPERTVGGLFRSNVPPNFFEYGVDYVDSLQAADAVVLPNNFLRLDDDARAYIDRFLSEAGTIPVIVFSFGDLTHGLQFDPRVQVLRLSTYRSTIGPNDHVVSTLIDDPGTTSVMLREKKQVPVVSFCGQASFQTSVQWLRYGVKVAAYTMVGIMRPHLKARLLGVYWRRKALRSCRGSLLVKTHFIIRSTFSGSGKTIELDPTQARTEFINSVRESDFALAPKGDGNYSNRFFEALALGRIPVLIDTDVVLPLEGEIDYSDIVVRVPMSKVSETPRYIREWYDRLDASDWEARQQKARSVFDTYLRHDVCIRMVFKSLGIQ